MPMRPGAKRLLPDTTRNERAAARGTSPDAAASIAAGQGEEIRPGDPVSVFLFADGHRLDAPIEIFVT